jgi:hypothetical protein
MIKGLNRNFFLFVGVEGKFFKKIIQAKKENGMKSKNDTQQTSFLNSTCNYYFKKPNIN